MFVGETTSFFVLYGIICPSVGIQEGSENLCISSLGAVSDESWRIWSPQYASLSHPSCCPKKGNKNQKIHARPILNGESRWFPLHHCFQEGKKMGHMLGISDVMMTDLLHLPRLMSRILAYLLAFLARWHQLASQSHLSEEKIRQLWLTNQPATVATSGGNSAYQKWVVDRSYDSASTWVPQNSFRFDAPTFEGFEALRLIEVEGRWFGWWFRPSFISAAWNHET